MKRIAVIILLLLGVLLHAQDSSDFVYTDSARVEKNDGEDTKKKSIPIAF